MKELVKCLYSCATRAWLEKSLSVPGAGGETHESSSSESRPITANTQGTIFFNSDSINQ